VKLSAVVRRWLKVADPTAITALEALQRALGYGRAIRGVSRSEVIAFSWGDGASEGTKDLERLARETNLVFNPNKHFMEIRTGAEPLHPGGNAWVLVYEPGDGADLSDAVARRRLLTSPPDAVRRGVLWELDLEGSTETVRSMAEEIAVTRSRTSGLLANPHHQRIRVLDASPTAADLAALLESDREIS